jgi:Rap1a immunity proteins
VVRVLDVFAFQGKRWARLGDKDRIHIGWVYRDYLDCQPTADTATSTSAPYPAFTGNTLLSSCTADPTTAPAKVMECVTYVVAVAGTMIVWQTVARDSAYFCVPEEAIGEQLKDIVVKWLRANPAERHLNGARSPFRWPSRRHGQRSAECGRGASNEAHTPSWLRSRSFARDDHYGDARGRDGGIRQELAVGVT